MEHRTGPPTLTRARLFLRFLRFGVLAFGGPVAQIDMLRAELVDHERWISRERFNRTLAVYQALPGPEAHELCVYFGMLARGRIGGVLAGLGFMLPGFLLVLMLAWIYVRYGVSSALLAGILAGFQPAVAALIARAVVRIGRRALTHPWLWLVAAIAATGQALDAPFWISLLAGGISFGAVERSHRAIAVPVVVAAGIGIWLMRAPGTAEPAMQTLVFSTPGSASLLGTGLKAGLLTFGGAYTAIPFVRHDAVVTGGWMTDAAFLDALSLSGILPAPLIIFGTFVGYVGAGVAGALVMTAGIFAPAFAFTLLGHRRLEQLVHDPRAHAFLDGIAAAVVGLIAVTAARLAPEAIPDAGAALIFAGALVVLVAWRARWAVLGVMLAAGAIGLLLEQL